MSLTINEAAERVAQIWGKARMITVRARPEGGVDVHLHPAGMASDTRGRNYSYHRLDANGHPVCHDDCQTLENTP